MPSIAAENKKWQAESDAKTLMEADVISNTPQRKRAAVTAAKSMAAEKAKEAAGMKKVASRSNVRRKQAAKRATRKRK
ncbi:MAG: hypothetical protein KAS32_15155 [Candidatus Peribacteraceae bacterium]|nr:hypothetical protein [Candidatus Peribacteraceae bacterium]